MKVSLIKKLLLCICVIVFYVSNLRASTVDTILTTSTAMKKQIKAVVILPDTYKSGERFPVVYLLHGYGGSYAYFTKVTPAIKALADQYKMILVCADANVSSWYLDSPVDPKWKYETYVATELVNWIDQHYSTIANRSGRAITGLSMGGHGALSLAFKHSDTFGAAGSMSGGVDIRPFPDNWLISERLGTQASFPDRWKENSVVENIYRIKANLLSLIIDCGKDDFFYNVNMELHERLLYANIPHDFIIRPGAHTSTYWANSITFQLLYFNNFFNKK
ncbi:alpha/beta hydrolase [Pedobacter duraquae]|uniref:S-formylglutathione hydrolase FrmB n=1 Tax=Pedobacter duraquae TaxID=425511 RepID=A0A4R6ILD7_9SPHI|nr:alpha/beta hydrolase-fold protein [Pedobacter duraquae]TDO22766.1 S-formylglutathione hydrolase FrmB [Pedobacter duraquae]